jgi:hypothetical protein
MGETEETIAIENLSIDELRSLVHKATEFHTLLKWWREWYEETNPVDVRAVHLASLTYYVLHTGSLEDALKQ